MPDWLAARIPDNADALSNLVMEWLHTNFAMVQLAGAQAGRGLVYIFLGIILGAMIALHEAMPREPHRNLSSALIERAKRLSNSFRKVVFAQVRISLLNTTVHRRLSRSDPAPFRRGLAAQEDDDRGHVRGRVAARDWQPPVEHDYRDHQPFLFGARAAMASLAFLILIHKLEYFLNARIIGQRIDSRAWELLMAMIAMEAALRIARRYCGTLYFAYVKKRARAQHGNLNAVAGLPTSRLGRPV
jgi:hypothetical protein